MGSLWHQFGRFNLVGLLGAVFQLLVYRLIMTRLDLPEAAASVIAVEAAVLHNFFWHERFTWRDRGPAALASRAPPSGAIPPQQRLGLALGERARHLRSRGVARCPLTPI